MKRFLELKRIAKNRFENDTFEFVSELIILAVFVGMLSSMVASGSYLSVVGGANEKKNIEAVRQTRPEH